MATLLARFLGIVCIAIAVVLGMAAIVAFFAIDSAAKWIVIGFCGICAIPLYSIGSRWLDGRSESPSRATRDDDEDDADHPRGRNRRARTYLRYEDFRWGKPEPTRKQFGFAMSLGVPVKNGMTKWTMSNAIDDALDQRQDDGRARLFRPKERGARGGRRKSDLENANPGQRGDLGCMLLTLACLVVFAIGLLVVSAY